MPVNQGFTSVHLQQVDTMQEIISDEEAGQERNFKGSSLLRYLTAKDYGVRSRYLIER